MSRRAPRRRASISEQRSRVQDHVDRERLFGATAAIVASTFAFVVTAGLWLAVLAALTPS
jgi:hypothetical protein